MTVETLNALLAIAGGAITALLAVVSWFSIEGITEIKDSVKSLVVKDDILLASIGELRLRLTQLESRMLSVEHTRERRNEHG